MDLLPLPFIGWFFAVVSVAALGMGAALIIAMHRAGELERRLLARSAWNDMALFGIWILGLAGSIGLLQSRPWGRDVLELFCWTLSALIALSAVTRLLAFKRGRGDQSGSWVGAIAGLLLVLIPVIAICGATISTLRSDAARAAFTR